MKINIKLLTLLASVTLLFGCGNKWLGAIGPEDGTLAPPSMMYQSEASINNAFTGTYFLIKEYYLDRHVTAGYKDYQLGLCYMGNDLMPNPGNWWTYEAQWTSSISGVTGYQSLFYWNMFYKVINNANAIIQGIEKEAPATVSEAFKKASIAEAKAVRSWALFQLARVYQKNYSQIADKNVKCLPVYTVPANDTLKGAPFASVEKVYAMILDGLSDANIALIPASQGSQYYRANKNVAYAWRAQIRLEMGNNWEGAKNDAALAREGYPLMSKVQYAEGFNTYNGEWIWGCPLQDDQALGYASFFSFADMIAKSPGYQTFFVNDKFVDLFSETDCRAMWFQWSELNPDGSKPTMYWASSKFVFKPNSFFNGDYVYIRSAEMMLIEAEAMARQGEFGAAADLLFELQSARDESAVKSGNTGDALIEEILVERRKELFGEVPVEYIDAKRFGKPMVRNGNQSINKTIQANDPRWLFQIPRSETDNNPFWKDEYQNKR